MSATNQYADDGSGVSFSTDQQKRDPETDNQQVEKEIQNNEQQPEDTEDKRT